MEKLGVGGLLALGWLLLAAYIVLLLIISLILGVKGMLESAFAIVAAQYRRFWVGRSAVDLMGYPQDWGLNQQEVNKK